VAIRGGPTRGSGADRKAEGVVGRALDPAVHSLIGAPRLTREFIVC
jgi:hypothetical protein